MKKPPVVDEQPELFLRVRFSFGEMMRHECWPGELCNPHRTGSGELEIQHRDHRQPVAVYARGGWDRITWEWLLPSQVDRADKNLSPKR